MKRIIPVAIPLLLVLILACNLPSGATGTATPAATATGLTTATSTAVTSTATVTATATQLGAPTVTVTSVACNAASFVADVTVPDDTIFQPNAAFTKTWKLKNAGSCTWTSGYQVVFDSGDQMGGPASQQLTNGSVAPGQDVDISVNLHAPGSDGTYKGNWKLKEPGGTVFGLSTGAFWVQIKTKSQAVVVPDWPIKRSGDSGPEVFALQHLLVARGEALTVDGNFGPITKTKVQHFQSVNGLTADGDVGPLTWPKLIVQVQQGSNGPAVRAVQKLLNDKFGYSLSVDGVFGPDTSAAVKDFQGDHGLSVDGIVGPQTWKTLVGS